MTTFDPAAWLEAYEALGGWYVVNADQRVMMGWSLEGDVHASKELQRLLMETKSAPEHRSALIEHILSRQHVPA